MLLLVNVYFPFPLLRMMLSCSSDVNLRLAYAPWPLPANEIAVWCYTETRERNHASMFNLQSITYNACSEA